MAKREYGFRIMSGRFADSDDLSVHIMVREEGAAYPCNPRMEGEHHIWDAPKKQDGLQLCDLMLHMWVYTSGASPQWTEPSVMYKEVHRVKPSDVAKMAKTLGKIEKEIAKTDAKEAGDVLMAMCKALGLTFFVYETHKASSWRYADSDWHFTSITEGRDKLRKLMAEKLPALA